MIYEYQDWFDDYSWHCDLLNQLKNEEIFPDKQYRKCFSEKYDRDRAVFCSARLSAAIHYLESHLEELNEGQTAVVGNDEALVSKHLMTALYRIYAQCPDEMLNEKYPVSLVLQMAKENEKKPDSI